MERQQQQQQQQHSMIQLVGCAQMREDGEGSGAMYEEMAERGGAVDLHAAGPCLTRADGR